MNVQREAKLYFRMAVSLIVLGCALYTILAGRSDAQNWAFGVVGAILGHWFKGT